MKKPRLLLGSLGALALVVLSRPTRAQSEAESSATAAIGTPEVEGAAPRPPLSTAVEDGWAGRGRRRPRRWFFVMDAGPTYLRIYDTSIYGGTISIGAAGEFDRVSLTLGSRLDYGALDTGLRSFLVDLDGTIGVRLGALRIAGGLGLGVMSISSATSDPAATATTVNVSALSSLDVARTDDHGGRLYVGLLIRSDVVLAGDAEPWVWGPAAVLGFRL